MPSSVRNAIPIAVFPPSLSRAFARSQEYPILESDYRNGESQRSVEAATSRKRWRLAKRLAPAQLAALRTFYEARNGPVEPFYFYDAYETVPKFSYDATGAMLNGRYIVRFDRTLHLLSSPRHVAMPSSTLASPRRTRSARASRSLHNLIYCAAMRSSATCAS